jgi:hypothetical protein
MKSGVLRANMTATFPYQSLTLTSIGSAAAALVDLVQLNHIAVRIAQKQLHGLRPRHPGQRPI